MEVRLESPEGPQVMSPPGSIVHFAKQTRPRQMQWAQRLARKGLARQGIRLDQKAVRRIAEQLGTQMLAGRTARQDF